jgi:peptidoglycan/xylan/chitin deacetylase (PgdA/CDA1 family)
VDLPLGTSTGATTRPTMMVNRMEGLPMRRALLTLLAIAMAVSMTAVTGLAGPDGVAAVTPTPTAPMRVRFEAGIHVGYQFTATGAIVASKSATLARPSGASTTRRASIPGRGVHLLIRDGIWAGFWIAESIVSHVDGIVGQTVYATPHRLAFPAGDVIGYRFTPGWDLASARVVRLSRASGASASLAASIDGVVYYAIVDGAFAGTWVPAGAPGAVKALGCRTGPRATGGAQVYSQVAGAGPEVALTFDLGGRTDPALDIVRRLLLHGVCTTIFPTGDAAVATAAGAVLDFIADYPAVFEVGNHTKDHCDLVRGGGDTGCPAGTPSTSFIQSQLTSAATLIQARTGQAPAPYWRPPYGAHNATVRAAAAGVGYTKTVMWHVDTIDWKPPPPVDTGPTTLQIVSRVVGGVGNGSVVLMHLGGWNTYDALPAVLRGLASRGLQPTSLSDLVGGD